MKKYVAAIMCAVFFGSFFTSFAEEESAVKNESSNMFEYCNYITGEVIEFNDYSELVEKKSYSDRESADDTSVYVDYDIGLLSTTNKLLKANYHNLTAQSSSLITVDMLSNLAQSPYSGICQIYIHYNNSDVESGKATGFFVGENSILTAAHNLVPPANSTITSIRIYYCFKINSTTFRFGYCSVISSVKCSTFTTNDTMYDYALLTIASSAGGNTGVFKINGLAANKTTNYIAAGYPGASSALSDNTPLSNPNRLAYDTGKLDKVESNYLRAKRNEIDLESGMSGGPLYVLNNNKFYALGIISRGRTILLTEYVYFCYINSTVYQFCSTYGDVGSVTAGMYLGG